MVLQSTYTDYQVFRTNYNVTADYFGIVNKIIGFDNFVARKYFDIRS